jgi:hypothetical protein
MVTSSRRTKITIERYNYTWVWIGLKWKVKLDIGCKERKWTGVEMERNGQWTVEFNEMECNGRN